MHMMYITKALAPNPFPMKVPFRMPFQLGTLSVLPMLMGYLGILSQPRPVHALHAKCGNMNLPLQHAGVPVGRRSDGFRWPHCHSIMPKLAGHGKQHAPYEVDLLYSVAPRQCPNIQSRTLSFRCMHILLPMLARPC
jgi:hypothetical protein